LTCSVNRLISRITRENGRLNIAYSSGTVFVSRRSITIENKRLKKKSLCFNSVVCRSGCEFTTVRLSVRNWLGPSPVLVFFKKREKISICNDKKKKNSYRLSFVPTISINDYIILIIPICKYTWLIGVNRITLVLPLPVTYLFMHVKNIRVIKYYLKDCLQCIWKRIFTMK